MSESTAGERLIADERLFSLALQNLQNEGHIEYKGEYGAEITTFVPFVAWLKQEGLLAGRRVITYAGMRPYYFFLDDDEFQAKFERRSFVRPQRRFWPSNSTYDATRQRWHACPDYRSHFKGRGRTFDRPVLFVQNKFTVEWDVGPINYLPLILLQKLFQRSADRFHVVYSRPRDSIEGKGYTADDNSSCEYPDIAMARQFEHVEILEETCLATGADYNTTKLEILAKTHVFVATQGGGAHLLACFGNSILLILHRRGAEYPHAYTSGPYKYLSDPPPLLLLAQTDEALAEGLKVVVTASVRNGMAVIHDRAPPIVAALRV
jgi:hypothetical protein